MRTRFQADADLKHAIIAGTLRRAASLDFRRAEAVPLEGLDDPVVLALAAEEGRVLVSHDVGATGRPPQGLSELRCALGFALIAADRGLRGGQAGDRYAVWGAGNVVHTHAIAEAY